MNVRITQLDGRLPNLALMRLASFHKSRRDAIYFTRSPYRHLDEPRYDHVYGSAIFEFSAERVARLQAEFPDANIGGTGSLAPGALVESIVRDHAGLDYDLYPKFRASIGFTQRGCRLKCKFCVVPKKEGKVRGVGTVTDIWRGPPHPRHLHLLDNDFFGQPEWRERIAEIRDGGFLVSFTQGVNVRAIDAETAAAVASIQYRDDDFKRRRLYCAWDNLKDEGVFFRGVDELERAGVPPRHLMTYMLVGFDPRETWERILHRFDRMVGRGIRPYPMVFDPGRRDLKAFQRWAVTGLYRSVPWSAYNVNARPRASDDQLPLI